MTRDFRFGKVNRPKPVKSQSQDPCVDPAMFQRSEVAWASTGTRLARSAPSFLIVVGSVATRPRFERRLAPTVINGHSAGFSRDSLPGCPLRVETNVGDHIGPRARGAC